MLIGSGFVLLAWIVLWIFGFVDAITAESDRIRLLPKAVWVVLILLFSGFAAIAWFIWGRPRGVVPASSSTPTVGGWQLGGAGPRRRSGPIAPDDDPEFLRQLGANRRRDERKRDNRGDEDPDPRG